MASHATCDHPATKAGRAACRRGAQTPSDAPKAPRTGAPKGATPKRPQKLAEREGVILTQPHDFVPHDVRPSLCKHCGQTPNGRLHDGVVGESRLHKFQAVCKHPRNDWVLKGATKKKAGHYYCGPCGKYIGEAGPKDLADMLKF